MANAEARKGKGMSFEFESAEEKEAFMTKCDNGGRKGAAVIKLLIKGFIEGKFKLD
jgi:hypothetical protein